MPTVDLIYDTDCPNVSSTRANLMRAFSKAAVTARWEEHRIGDPEAPQHVRGFGSPTILVDGRDVAGAERGQEACCRLYDAGSVTTGAPPVEAIATALRFASDGGTSRPPRNRLRSTLAVLPGVGVALMPKVACPLCWPAYAGALSAAGLPFLMEDRWLLPISAVLLLAAFLALAWRAERRHGYGPAVAGLLAGAAILGGKFGLDSELVVYGGIASLFAASVWNAWPRKKAAAGCPSCVPQP